MRLSDRLSINCVCGADVSFFALKVTFQAMDWHRRIGRTLLCLVVSTTLGALILHSGQPAHSNANESGTELMGRTAGQSWRPASRISQPLLAIAFTPESLTLVER